MKERPILFSGPMVRAILDNRKTQTRRVVKPQPQVTTPPDATWHDAKRDLWRNLSQFTRDCCPYGVVGDRLWVKETWRPSVDHGCVETCDCGDVWVRYADGSDRYIRDEQIGPDWTLPKAAKRGNVSPLFMPRWASRITLEITGVRVERLNEISEADAEAEGIDLQGFRSTTFGIAGREHRINFHTLWDSINGTKHPWASNPFVWVLEFKRIGGAP